MAARMSSGCSPTVTSRDTSRPSRSTVTGTLVPGLTAATTLRSSLEVFTGRSLKRVMMSPCRMPARPAGVSSPTLAMSTPALTSTPMASASSWVTSWMTTPRKPRVTLPVSMSEVMIWRAMLMGMAKPMPMLPPERLKMAVFTPTTSPFRLTRGPPELPGLMAASVWMKSS